MYFNGFGVERSIDQAIKLFELAAENGNPEAAFNLGNIYFEGVQDSNISQDFRKAIKYFKISAEHGNAVSQYKFVFCFFNFSKQERLKKRNRLGTIYYNGYGVEQENEIALEFFEQAAKQEHLDAVLMSSLM